MADTKGAHDKTKTETMIPNHKTDKEDNGLLKVKQAFAINDSTFDKIEEVRQLMGAKHLSTAVVVSALIAKGMFEGNADLRRHLASQVGMLDWITDQEAGGISKNHQPGG
jgi:hypothetical protein